MSLKITDSMSFHAVSKFHRGSERERLILSGVLIVLVKTAWMDRELKNIEMSYLMREIGTWFESDKTQRKKLIDMHSTLIRRNLNFSKYIPLHLEYLERSINEEEKRSLIEAAAIISRSDLSVSKAEELWIEGVSKALGFSSKGLAEIIMNARFIANKRLAESAFELPIAQDEPECIYKDPVIVIEFE
jgi:hypothetical protein